MVHARKFFPEIFLNAENLKQPVKLTICEANVELLKSERGEEQKIVLYFAETRAKAEREGDRKKERRIALGKSLLKDFETLTGTDDTSVWVGKAFMFFPGKAIKGGQTCIRARAVTATTAPSVDAASTMTEPKETETNG